MKPTDDKYTYFQPGEAVFLLRHDPVISLDEEKINSLIAKSNDLAKENDIQLTIKRRQERELHFPVQGFEGYKDYLAKKVIEKSDQENEALNINIPEAFSLIPVRIEQNEQPMEDNTDKYVQPSQLAYLIQKLDDTRKDIAPDGVTLEAVTPNWLASPASEYGGGGGPGSLPVPYAGDPGSAPYKINLPGEINKLWHPNEDERGRGVKVVILDTAPCLHDLTWAYERYQKVNPRNRKKHHPLIESLLRPGGPFHLHPASKDDLFRMRAVHLRDHNYNMTDHGLFVAGIIHSIAPAAEIHLYEVLNSEGVGDLVTIYKALLDIALEQYQLKLRGKEPLLVVNCSLMLNIPLNGDPAFPNTAKLIPTKNPPIVGHRLTDMDRPLVELMKTGFSERSGLPIKAMCDLLSLLDSKVIAAAGNDWRAGDAGRPQARMPASFESVQGVGAYPKDQNLNAFVNTGDYQAASYSNLSDDPDSVGIMALGGEAGEGKGVLGIYIGEFPPLDELTFGQRIIKCLIELLGGRYVEPRNKSDWAWWAGTSFATPIVTGSVAAVLSNPGGSNSAQAAIDTMYGNQTIRDNNGRSANSYKEDLLYITQG